MSFLPTLASLHFCSAKWAVITVAGCRWLLGVNEQNEPCVLGPGPAEVRWEWCFLLFTLPAEARRALTPRPPTWHQPQACLLRQPPLFTGEQLLGSGRRWEALPSTQICALMGGGDEGAAC